MRKDERKPNMHYAQITMTPLEYETLKRLARTYGLSRSAFVNLAIKYMDEQKPVLHVHPKPRGKAMAPAMSIN